MYKDVADAIREFDSIVIVGHIRPDGDCYGSQMGLKDAILHNFPNKKVYCVGSGMPIFFDFIGGMDHPSDEEVKNSLGIIVDLNELYRCEDQRVPTTCKKLVLIDHHIRMCKFDFPTLVDEDACSSCEIIANLLEHEKWGISERGANALYLGLLTDSSRFEYVDNFPRVFKIAAHLCTYGANPQTINRLLSSTSERFLRLKGYALTHYKKKGGIIYLHLTGKDLERLKIKQSYGTAIINNLGNVKDYPIWVTFFEDDNHTCIIEFRSNEFNVVQVAMKYGGGGHMLAAGVTIRNFNEEILNTILLDLNNVIEGKY